MLDHVSETWVTGHPDATAIRLSIGDFAKMTYLSIKSLRRYHEMGLLIPAEIDMTSGYRYYTASQVATGQLIRRFRDLGMPLEQVREVLNAPDASARNDITVTHLRKMEATLQQTQQTVSSLRALLERPQAPIAVEYRSVGPVLALAICEPVAMTDIDSWWSAVFSELHDVLRATGAERTGPDAALYSSEFFEEDAGDVTAFVPIGPTGGSRSGRVRGSQVPGAELAVTLHQGSFSELDRTYGALGTFVSQREIGVPGPIREYYLVSGEHTADESEHRTEVCWPVFHTRGEQP